MGLRFRKSVTLFPGVKVNFGLHSTSLSVGGKGFRTTYSSTGRVTRSVGIPGTGISYVTSTNTRSQQRNTARNTSTTRRATNANNISAPRETAPQPQVPQGPTFAEVDERIHAIYRQADNPIDWSDVLCSDEAYLPHWDYLKARAEKILNGDIDTYYEVISDTNPLDDLLQYGSEFECGTDDPRMIAIHFQVNSTSVLADATRFPTNQYNNLLQDYVCGCTIRIARDMFALLPIRHIIIDASDKGHYILSVNFTRDDFENLDFATIDASDTVEQFNHRMSYSDASGFASIEPLDD